MAFTEIPTPDVSLVPQSGDPLLDTAAGVFVAVAAGVWVFDIGVSEMRRQQ